MAASSVKFGRVGQFYWCGSIIKNLAWLDSFTSGEASSEILAGWDRFTGVAASSENLAGLGSFTSVTVSSEILACLDNLLVG